VRVDGRWVTWWDRAHAPIRWTAPLPALAAAQDWQEAAPGVDWTEFALSGAGEAWRLRVILVRIAPTAVQFRLAQPPRRPDGYSGRWNVRDAPPEAIVAVNAGQFTGGPWGWVVREGVVRQPPGTGALAPGVAFTDRGQAVLLPPDSLPLAPGVREGFQSYPTLLAGDGEVPRALREPGLGVDLQHRDARLAFGLLRDGRVLLALTRFEGLGGVLEIVPFGLTTPEMAAVMGAVGCARAVLLDGGISGQLQLVARGKRHRWPGLRDVAMGLVVLPRAVPPGRAGDGPDGSGDAGPSTSPGIESDRAYSGALLPAILNFGVSVSAATTRLPATKSAARTRPGAAIGPP